MVLLGRDGADEALRDVVVTVGVLPEPDVIEGKVMVLPPPTTVLLLDAGAGAGLGVLLIGFHSGFSGLGAGLGAVATRVGG